MKARPALCLVLAALCALQPAGAALAADGPAVMPAPAQLDLSYRPDLDAVVPESPALDTTAQVLTAASATDDGGTSNTQLWVIVGVVVVLALVLGGGGGGY